MRRLALAIVLALACGAACAAPPAEPFAAEQRRDWDAAAAGYREYLATHPDDVETWRRLSDVEAARGDATKAAEALGSAVAARPGDAGLHALHSRALATAQDKVGALAAIERALAIEPDRVEFLLARARLAGWNADYALAERSIARVEELDPSNKELLADKARLRAWRGRNAEAAALFEEYLAARPDDKAAALDRIRVDTWRGDYASALDALDAYDERHGASPDSRALRARALAWSGWRDAGEAINAELLAAGHDPYGTSYTETLLRRQSFVPRDAAGPLATVVALQPGVDETRDLVLGTELLWRSRVWLDYSLFRDSDSIDVPQLELGGWWGATDRLRVLYGIAERSYDADAGTGLEAPQGEVDETRVRVGARFAFDRDVAGELVVGSSDVDDAGDTTIGLAALDWRASDAFSMRIAGERDRVGISPRAMALGLTRNGVGGYGAWTPDPRWRLRAELRADSFSDGNDRQEANFTATRTFVRGDRWNLDLGAGTWWTSFDDDLDNGYYDPSHYNRISLFALAYYKIDENNGVNLYFAGGAQDDETLDSWESAYDVAVEGTFGIFSDWQLRVRGAYTDRRQATGSFDGRSFGVNLEYRF